MNGITFAAMGINQQYINTKELAYFLTEAFQQKNDSQITWVIKGAEAWTLQSQETHSLEFLLDALPEMLPGQKNYKISRPDRTPSPLNPSRVSPDTENPDCLGTLAVCKKITSFGKHTRKTSNDSGREEGH